MNMLRCFDNILEKSSKGLIVIILIGASDSFLDILNWNESDKTSDWRKGIKISDVILTTTVEKHETEMNRRSA